MSSMAIGTGVARARRLRVAVMAIGTACVLPGVASADLTPIAGYGPFGTLAGPSSGSITFNGLATSGNPLFNLGTSVVGDDGVRTMTFSSSGDMGLFDRSITPFSSDVFSTFPANTAVTITMDQPIRMIGGRVFLTDIDFNEVPGQIDISFNNADGDSVMLTDPTAADFFGVISDTPFDVVTLTPSDPLNGNPVWLTMDNLVFGVPEPASAALLIGGVGVLLRRRRA